MSSPIFSVSIEQKVLTRAIDGPEGEGYRHWA